MSWCLNDTRTYIRGRRAEAFAPTGTQLVAFTGRYYSEEVDAAYDVIVRSDTLIARSRRGTEDALKPEARYVVRVTGATNLIGKKGDGDVGFTVPKPAAPDSTRRTPSRPPPPPQPPPTSKPPS